MLWRLFTLSAYLAVFTRFMLNNFFLRLDWGLLIGVKATGMVYMGSVWSAGDEVSYILGRVSQVSAVAC